MEEKPKYIFVYNVDSSIVFRIKNFFRKTFSMGGYECNLCDLINCAVSTRKEWKEFIKTLGIETILLYRNDFRKKFPLLNKVPLPAVFKKGGGAIVEIVTAEEINKRVNLKQLIKLIQRKLA
ncbi:hypothetical protein JW766_01000 [Candidatus Dojkabacteria bacterium]|nr:hypothetical protein [Candidatus Dojkabacteria bacterium]